MPSCIAIDVTAIDYPANRPIDYRDHSQEQVEGMLRSRERLRTLDAKALFALRSTYGELELNEVNYDRTLFHLLLSSEQTIR